jgi:CelD/BcsL family acetyltransferase involved in cellulose biosynthesis
LLDGDGYPSMLLALGTERRGGARVLTFLDGGVSDYNAPVLFGEARDCQAGESREILEAILAALPPVDAVVFEKMPADVCGRPNPLLALGTEPWPCSGHVAITAATWQEFAASHVKHSKRFSRYYRQLERCGPLVYSVADASMAEGYLEALLAQKEARFIETRVPGYSAHPGMADFYREFTRRFVGTSLLHLSAVTSSEKIIGAQWGLRKAERYYYLICGYASGLWERYSPGRLITEAMLKWCHEAGMAVADFGIGDETYKYEYCDQHVALHRTLIAVTLRGRLFVAMMRGLEWLRSTAAWQRLRPLKWMLLRRFTADA